MTQPKVKVMLDSGAFSAWRKGEVLDVKAYMAFIKEYRGLIDSYVCLDTIPGSMGRMDRGQSSIEKSAAASYRNQQVMRDAGLAPIPVFHQGERYEWLEKYLSDGEPYIGISPYLRSTQDALINWLDQCFTRVTDSTGRPFAKTHGFGATAHESIWRYPWHSVDSTAWVMPPCYGMIIVPALGSDGKPNLRLPTRQYYVGGGTGDAVNWDWVKRGFDDLSDAALDWIQKYAVMCGTSISGFRNDQYARTGAYIKYFLLLEKARGAVLFKYRRASFVRTVSTYTPIDVKFKIIFATNLTHKQGRILTRFGAMDRLLSYWNLRECKSLRERLERYVTKGYQTERDDIVDVGGEIALEEPAVRTNWETMNYTDFRRRRLAGRFMGDVSKDEQKATT